MSSNTTRFSDRVADYVAYRPSYPAAAIDTLLSRAQLSPGDSVADIGSGTGISTSLLLERGLTVYAVEPNAAMRSAAEQAHSANPAFHSVAAPAEATTLPACSVKLVLAAQAFHWFDAAKARAEFRRITTPPHVVALLWNDRQTSGSPFLDGYEEILRTLGTDYAHVNHRNLTAESKAIADFYAGPFELLTFHNHQDLTLPALLGRAFSSSYTPREGDPRRQQMETSLKNLFDKTQQNDTVRLSYVTQLFLGALP